MNLRQKFAAAIEAEFAVMASRLELSMMFCDLMQPDEVAEQVAAQRAAQQRVVKLERLRDYYTGKGL